MMAVCLVHLQWIPNPHTVIPWNPRGKPTTECLGGSGDPNDMALAMEACRVLQQPNFNCTPKCPSPPRMHSSDHLIRFMPIHIEHCVGI